MIILESMQFNYIKTCFQQELSQKLYATNNDSFFFFLVGGFMGVERTLVSQIPPFCSKERRCVDSYCFLCSLQTHFGPLPPFFFFLNSSSMLWQPHIVQYFSFGCETFVFPTRMKDVKLRDYIHLRIPHIAGLARGLKGVFLSVVSPSGFLTVLTWEMKMSPVPKSLCDHKS